MTTDSLGRFEFDSVPEETVHISVGSRDHHLAEGTPGIDRWLQRVTLPAAGPLPELELRLVANAPGTSAAVHRDTTRVGAPRP